MMQKRNAKTKIERTTEKSMSINNKTYAGMRKEKEEGTIVKNAKIHVHIYLHYRYCPQLYYLCHVLNLSYYLQL
jgi:hypothetical protein